MDYSSRFSAKRKPKRRDNDRGQGSESPPASPRVVLLRPTASASASNPSPAANLVTIATRSASPHVQTVVVSSSIRNDHSNSLGVSREPTDSPSPIPRIIQSKSQDDRPILPQDTASDAVLKLVDGKNWTILEQSLSDCVMPETFSSGYSVIAAVGAQSCGKSSLLNVIAGQDVFKTHANDDGTSNLLQHITVGIDVHITKERQFLLDTQAILSASLLDEFINTSQPTTNLANEIAEPETYMYAISLQQVSFLLAVCDNLIVISDWTVDVHLVKLIATALMMVSSSSVHANILWYINNKLDQSELANVSDTLDLLLGRGTVKLINADEKEILHCTMKKSPRLACDLTGKSNGQHSSEKSWLLSAVRFWENSIKKSTLFSDYARFMP